MRRRKIAGFGLPARKTDLAGVVTQMRRTLRQKNRRAFLAQHDRKKNRCLNRVLNLNARLITMPCIRRQSSKHPAQPAQINQARAIGRQTLSVAITFL